MNKVPRSFSAFLFVLAFGLVFAVRLFAGDVYGTVDSMLIKDDLVSAKPVLDDIYNAHSVERAGGEAGIGKLMAYRAVVGVISAAQACLTEYQTFMISGKENGDILKMRIVLKQFFERWSRMLSTKPFPVSRELVDHVNSVMRSMKDMQTSSEKAFTDAQTMRASAVEAQREKEEKDQQTAQGARLDALLGTWQVIYYVKFGPPQQGGAQTGEGLSIVRPEDKTTPLLHRVSFLQDGEGEFIFDGDRSVKFFYQKSLANDEPVYVIQPQGFPKVEWYYALLPDGRILSAFAWPQDDGKKQSLMAVIEKR